MFRVVLDTNVFVSGASLGTKTPPSHIVNAWRNNTFMLIVSPALIAEYQEVLLRPHITKFTGLSNKEIERYISDV